MSILSSVENHQFSEHAHTMFGAYAKAGPTDEMALVVLSAAAFFLAREAQASGRHRSDLVVEFADLVKHADINLKTNRLQLRVVGGTEA